MKFVLVICAALACLSACSAEVLTPDDSASRSVLVTADRHGEFQTQLSLVGSGNSPASSATIMGHMESALLLADSATLLLGVVRSDTRRDIVTIDARTLRETSRRTISNRLVPSDQGEIGILAAETLTESPDRRWLYLSKAVRGGVLGLARVNAQTNVAEAFSGPWQVRATIRMLPPASGRPDGALVVHASRDNSGIGLPQVPAIYLLHPSTLVPFDSITPSMLGDFGVIINVLVLDHGQALLVGTGSKIIRYDLVNRRVSASARRTGLGAIVPLADRGPFAVLDQGIFPDHAGTGIIYLLSPDLTTIDSVDVSTPLGGTPHSNTATVMGGGTFDEQAGELYVRTGSAPLGPFYTPQPARTIVVNINERRVRRIIPLVGDNFGLAFRMQFR